MNSLHALNCRVLISIGLLSASIIAYQLVLMQILSLVQWYYFAYMVISIALLGFGAAGTFLTIFREQLIKKFEFAVPLLIITTGIFMSTVIWVSQISAFRFDTYLLFTDRSQILNLLLTYLIFFMPFFSGALAVGLFFIRYTDSIGNVYFANLAGSGIGGIIVISLIWYFLPNEMPAIISLLPFAAGLLLISGRTKTIIILAASVLFITIVFYLSSPPVLVLSQFKNLSKTLQLPEAKIITEKNSPYGLAQVVYSPVLRFAPGLSLKFNNTIPVRSAIFNNGNWVIPVVNQGTCDSPSIADFTTNALPYTIGNRENVLILNTGTGLDVVQALSKKAGNIIVVEPNPVIISLMKNESGSVYKDPRVKIKNTEPRTFIINETSKFDLITLPVIGSFEGSSGLYALQEQYILTTESISEMWQLLKPEGVICITCWMDYPFRNPLKVLSTLAEAIEKNIHEEPSTRIAAVRGWGTLSFILKRSPITPEESKKIREFCSTMLFDPVILPDVTREERTLYNKIQDEQFFIYIDEIMSSERNNLYSDYDFYIKPATDDKPFFSQFLRWNNIPHLSRLFGSQSIPFFETGYVFAAFALIQVLLASVVLILLPLFFFKLKSSGKLKVFLYFSGIGIGYMFVEMVLIQRFILYFGNPIYSAASVISSMLICSGAGSFFSSRIKFKKRNLSVLLLPIILLILAYAVFLTNILRATIGIPIEFKLIFSFIFIAPLSFLMGFPFPVGIRILSVNYKEQIPWAWGINGSFSVVSTVLAVIIAVELGFTWVMLFASAAYLLPVTANFKKLLR
jgi:hypothetical protein